MMENEEWVSVNCELPQKFGTYLVTNYRLNSYNKLEAETRAARFFPRDRERYAESDLLEDVRYWKPLPPPCEEK